MGMQGCVSGDWPYRLVGSRRAGYVRKCCQLCCPTVLCVMEVQWCTISDPEQQKCKDMSKAFQGAGIQPSLLCIQGTSSDHCVQLIKVRPLPSDSFPTPGPDKRALTKEECTTGPFTGKEAGVPLPGLGNTIS